MDFTGRGNKVARYRGFSSFAFESTGSFLVTDMDIVKSDLMNHIFTRRGERFKMSSFGTSIPDLVFEPLEEDLVDIITDEITAVINYDPRVKLVSINAVADYDNNAVLVSTTIRYIELNVTGNLNFNVEFIEN